MAAPSASFVKRMRRLTPQLAAENAAGIRKDPPGLEVFNTCDKDDIPPVEFVVTDTPLQTMSVPTILTDDYMKMQMEDTNPTTAPLSCVPFTKTLVKWEQHASAENLLKRPATGGLWNSKTINKISADANFTESIQVEGCHTPVTTASPQGVTLVTNPTYVTQISLLENDTLALGWTIFQPGGDMGKVFITQGDTESWTNCTAYKTTISNVTIEDRCFSGIVRGEDYNISLTTGALTSPITYATRIPQEISADPASWTTIVALAIYMKPDNSKEFVCRVVFAPAPDSWNISTYDVSLNSSIFNLHQTVSKDHPYTEGIVTGLGGMFQASVVPNIANSTISWSPHVHTTASSTDPIKTPSTTSDVMEFTSTFTSTEEHRNTGAVSMVTDSPDVETTTEDPERQKKVIVGSTIGAVVGVAALIIISCIIYRKRTGKDHCCTSCCEDGSSYNNIELSLKNSPSVLILYSYDCQKHEQTVIEFASYLKHILKCHVSMDIWEQNDVMSGGATQWLLAKLEACQFVIIICSTGARFKCMRKRKFTMKQGERPVPDIFSLSVDRVAERMWSQINSGQPLNQFIVAYFDYAGENDVPPKLDKAQQFCLMQDIYKLHCHLHRLDPTLHKSSAELKGKTYETFHKTQTGAQLCKAINQAREFFHNNPDWIGEIIEPIPDMSESGTPCGTLDRTKSGPSEKGNQDSFRNEEMLGDTFPPDSSVQRSSPLTDSHLSDSEDEVLLEKRKKKRKLDEEKLIKNSKLHWAKKMSQDSVTSLTSLLRTSRDKISQRFVNTFSNTNYVPIEDSGYSSGQNSLTRMTNHTPNKTSAYTNGTLPNGKATWEEEEENQSFCGGDDLDVLHGSFSDPESSSSALHNGFSSPSDNNNMQVDGDNSWIPADFHAITRNLPPMTIDPFSLKSEEVFSPRQEFENPMFSLKDTQGQTLFPGSSNSPGTLGNEDYRGELGSSCGMQSGSGQGQVTPISGSVCL